MVKVIRIDDEGTEVAAIELDDFTVEIVYSGIATMLAAAASGSSDRAGPSRLTKGALQRQARILNRILA